jgi:hypothetical protein
VYVAWRLWAFWHELGAVPAILPDSFVYEQSSRIPLLSIGFFSSWEPWGLPLFYKLLPGPTGNTSPIAQSVVSVVAWLILAWVVSTFIGVPWLRITSFLLVLGFSLSSVIGQWDGALLTESLTLSEAALLVAALLLVLRSPSRRNAALVLLAAFAFAATRDPSGYLAVMLLVPVAITLGLRRARRIPGALVLGAVLIGLAVFAGSEAKRWQIPMLQLVGIRVMSNQSMTAYFTGHGMPLDQSMVPLLFTAPDPPSPFVGQPALDAFHAWLDCDGRPTYWGYLLSHPGKSLIDPLEDLGNMIGPTVAASGYVVAPNDSVAAGLLAYRQAGYRPALPAVAQAVLYPGARWRAFAAMAIALAALIGSWARGHARVFWLVPALLIVTIVPYAVLVWDGVPLEVARHAPLVGVLGRLGLWLTVLFLADAHLAARATTLDQGRVAS